MDFADWHWSGFLKKTYNFKQNPAYIQFCVVNMCTSGDMGLFDVQLLARSVMSSRIVSSHGKTSPLKVHGVMAVKSQHCRSRNQNNAESFMNNAFSSHPDNVRKVDVWLWYKQIASQITSLTERVPLKRWMVSWRSGKQYYVVLDSRAFIIVVFLTALCKRQFLH